MPYCVKCGVELASSEKACPLCLTPVIIPGENVSFGAKPYPEKLEIVSSRIDRRYGAKLAMLFLLIPMLAVLACDLAISLKMTWSAYVLGAGGLILCCAILPFALNIRRPYWYLTMDFCCAAGYLALIAWRVGDMRWYLPVALPVTLLAGAACVSCVYAARRKRPALIRFSNVVLIAALLPIGIELFTDMFIAGRIRLMWSLCVFIPLLAFAGIFRVIERDKKLKAMIERRLFL